MLRTEPKPTDVQPAVRDVVQLVRSAPPDPGEHNKPAATEHQQRAASTHGTRHISSERGLATVSTLVELAAAVQSADSATTHPA